MVVNSPLAGPKDRYRLAVEALASQDGKHFTRSRTEAGIPLGGGNGEPATGEAPGVPPSSFLVVVDEAASLILQPGENGMTVKDIRILNADHLRLTAKVTPGSVAPDWLPAESSFLLFDGDRQATIALPPRYIPFDGMLSSDDWPQSDFAPLDVVAVALGRSVERANAILANRSAPGGTALLTGVTVRMGVSRLDLGQGRMMLTLTRPGDGRADQFVELTMTAGLASGVDELSVEEEAPEPETKAPRR